MTRTTLIATLSSLTVLASTGCAKEAYDPEALEASARMAISYADEKALDESVPRDTETLTDERILEETTSIADYAVDKGCDVLGALGGTWTEGGDAKIEDGGDLEGRWFDMAQEIGGDLAGTWTPGS